MTSRQCFLSGQYAGHGLDLPESLVLGPAPGYGVALGDDPAVSAEHCRISVREGRVLIEDLDSTNGTEVNGQRLEGTVELHDGDEIVVGETRIKLELKADEVAEAVEPSSPNSACACSRSCWKPATPFRTGPM